MIISYIFISLLVISTFIGLYNFFSKSYGERKRERFMVEFADRNLGKMSELLRQGKKQEAYDFIMEERHKAGLSTALLDDETRKTLYGVEKPSKYEVEEIRLNKINDLLN